MSIFWVSLTVWLIICLTSNSWLIMFYGSNIVPCNFAMKCNTRVLVLYACCKCGSRAAQSCLIMPFLIIDISRQNVYRLWKSSYYLHECYQFHFRGHIHVHWPAGTCSVKLRNGKLRNSNRRRFQPRLVECK